MFSWFGGTSILGNLNMDKTKKYGRRTPLFSKRTWERTLTSLGCCLCILCFVGWCFSPPEVPVRILAGFAFLNFACKLRLYILSEVMQVWCNIIYTCFFQQLWMVTRLSKHGKLGEFFPPNGGIKSSNLRKIIEKSVIFRCFPYKSVIFQAWQASPEGPRRVGWPRNCPKGQCIMSPTFSAAGIANMQHGDPEIFDMTRENLGSFFAIFMGYYKSIVWYKWYIYNYIYIHHTIIYIYTQYYTIMYIYIYVYNR